MRNLARSINKKLIIKILSGTGGWEDRRGSRGFARRENGIATGEKSRDLAR